MHTRGFLAVVDTFKAAFGRGLNNDEILVEMRGEFNGFFLKSLQKLLAVFPPPCWKFGITNPKFFFSFFISFSFTLL